MTRIRKPFTPEQLKHRAYRLRERKWRVFGGSWELFHFYWEKQGHRCGICCRKLILQSGTHKTEPHFDHCHETLRARGILCIYCNSKLDWAIRYKEEIEEYLK